MESAERNASTVLIVGGGIAGPVLAFWLVRAGFTCTIVERADAPRTTGQQVDIRCAARDIVGRMGLEDAIRARAVKEDGVLFMDNSGKIRAQFLAQADGSFTTDLEILRGDLAHVFNDATRQDAEWLLGTRVVALELGPEGNCVQATLAGAAAGTRSFDLVVIADGMNSATRRMVFADDGDVLHPLGQHMAFFTIPSAAHDRSLATSLNVPGGRMVVVRPDTARSRAGAYLAVCEPDSRKSVFAGYEQMRATEQQDIWARLFDGVGGEAARVIAAMPASDDFFMQAMAQVKAPRWTALNGRVVLLGDAACCPSPVTGLGTSSAIIGAYILAGELAKVKAGRDWASATATYEHVMRPIAERSQRLMPGAPALFNPQTSWGVALLHRFHALVSYFGIDDWFQRATLPPFDALPVYDLS